MVDVACSVNLDVLQRSNALRASCCCRLCELGESSADTCSAVEEPWLFGIRRVLGGPGNQPCKVRDMYKVASGRAISIDSQAASLA